MATAANLKEAFVGASQTNRKCCAFAKKAEANKAATMSFPYAPTPSRPIQSPISQ